MLQKRYRQILWFFARAIFHIGFWDIFISKLGFRRYVERSRPERLRRIASQYRILAVQLGGVMIKVGQFLSSRADIFPAEITEELAGLQDEVPEEEFDQIRKVAEVDFGRPLEQCFAFINPIAIAAASLGQVHQARLFDSGISTGKFPQTINNDEISENLCEVDKQLLKVVVKIQRPNIEFLIDTDLAAISTVGRWIQSYKPIRKRADIPKLLGEFKRILYQEIDYLNEGKNVEVFADNFAGIKGVRVPRVIWSHTTERVLTLEDVGGIKISSYDAITDAGISRGDVAGRLLDVYFKQIFEDGFFHADPHPGNLFVNPCGISETGNVEWELALVDFGMVGVINPDTQHGLREMLIAIATRDTSRLISAYQLLNVLLPGANLELLEKADEKVFERFWGKNMSEFRDFQPEELRELLAEFRELVFSLPFQIPHNLIFLARTVGLLSGMCAGLDPVFNVWNHIAPYAQKLLFRKTEHFDGVLPGGITELWQELANIIQRLIALPGRAEALLAKVERGELNIHDIALEEQVRRLTIAIQQMSGAIILTGILIGAVHLYLEDAYVISGLMGLIALFLFIFVVVHRN
jgi:predicted unusual protein kinase regulating ubiquinone biosynthesis (AarF/ABC1/UbiB family)